RTFQIKLGDAVMQSLIYISMFFICLELQSVLESLLIQFAAHQLAAHTPNGDKKIIIIDPEKKRTFNEVHEQLILFTHFFITHQLDQHVLIKLCLALLYIVFHQAFNITFYFKHDLYCNNYFVFLFILSQFFHIIFLIKNMPNIKR
ncbi:hypothetical protein ACJX0J_037089, partial [Zea mays]